MQSCEEGLTWATVRSSAVRSLLLILLTVAFGPQVIHGLGAATDSVPIAATAVFRGVDQTTLGDWIGVYGAQGYGLINDTLSYPPYASVTIANASNYTWAASTDDERALQRLTATDRVAACVYSSDSFTIDIALTDGLTHQVALYAVDWESSSRSEQIDVFDAASGTLLDTRLLSGYQGGQYLIWNLSGHVTLRVTNTGPVNAVVSGLFFADAAARTATTVTLGSAAGVTTYSAPATISLVATASATVNNAVTGVEFLNGTTVIGAAVTSPYTMTWTGVPIGSYSLTARAIDGTGSVVTSAPLAVTVVASTAALLPPSVPPSAASAPLVHATDLVYQGAFRLPQGPIGGSSFDYGGTALAFNPVGGSLFMVGHDWQQQVAEVTIPAVSAAATTLESLSTATVIQPFADATEGTMARVLVGDGDATVKVGGLLPYQGQLYLTAYAYYDGEGLQSLSHFVSGTDLSVLGDVRGPYRVGELGAGFVSGYFGLVPSEWQSALGGPVLNGQCCLSIISRTSYGPALFAIDPTQLGAIDPLAAAPLVYYTSDHPLSAWDADSTLFNGSTNVTGVVFPTGTRSVLFFGRQGLGPFCYGEGVDCLDPTDASKGVHGYPYAYYVWAYDAADLAAVRSGLRQPWEVVPYAVWTLSLPFGGGTQINGAAYDPATGRIFVSQAYGDGTNPLIHVFTVGSASSAAVTPPVATPTAPPASAPPATAPPAPNPPAAAPPVATPPSVSVVTPTDGAAALLLKPITVTAAASDSDGKVSSVAFYVNGEMIGTAATSPYQIDWAPPAVGSYQISVVATDDTGLTSAASVTVSVRPSIRRRRGR